MGLALGSANSITNTIDSIHSSFIPSSFDHIIPCPSFNKETIMTSTTMRGAILHKNGDPTTTEVISVQEGIEIPKPAKDEILVKVAAASINPIDWKLMKGEFPGLRNGPTGFDVSGTVEEVGGDAADQDDSVPSFAVGDEIYADAAATKGSFAEYTVVKKVAASRKPKNIDMKQAAALPLASLTALQGLLTYGKLKEGHKVCILGGSGGVGSIAIQMAKALGASEVFATGSSMELIKGFGADTVINYREKSVVDEIRGKELDLVFDTVGGYEGWQAAQGALKKGGIFVTIVGDGGGLPSMIGGIIWRKLMSKIAGGPAYNLFLTNTNAPEVIVDMKKITELVEAGSVTPVLDDRTFELTTESMHDMIKASMSHRAKGKLVLKVNC